MVRGTDIGTVGLTFRFSGGGNVRTETFAIAWFSG